MFNDPDPKKENINKTTLDALWEERARDTSVLQRLTKDEDYVSGFNPDSLAMPFVSWLEDLRRRYR